MVLRTCLTFSLIILYQNLSWAAAKNNKSQVGSSQTVKWAPEEYIVKLRAPAEIHTEEAINSLLKAYSSDAITQDAATFLIKKAGDQKQVLAELKKIPSVAYAEPNYEFHILGSPSDSEYGRLWGMNNTGQLVKVDSATPPDQCKPPSCLPPLEIQGIPGIDISAEKAWSITTGSSDVVVAVIDTGVNRNDPELRDNMWVNLKEKNGEKGVDDDGNGFVDDVYGWNFSQAPAGVKYDPTDPMDDQGHGTHCSGTIGAKGNNGLGVAGVTWNVKIMALKFLNSDGSGYTADAIKAVDYATANGAQIMSNSWGGGGYSKALEDAIRRAEEKGILFVAAAGNTNPFDNLSCPDKKTCRDNDVVAAYPANYSLSNVIAVASVDPNGEVSNFSHYGKTSVHVAAPGYGILSTTIVKSDAKDPTPTKATLASWRGTSMATPHVSGVAALLLSKEPGLKAADIKTRIMSTAMPLYALQKTSVSGGMVNAYNALTNTVPEPLPPDPNDPAKWDKQSNAISSPHPYSNNSTQEFMVNVMGVDKFVIHFSKFETEKGYDFLKILDGAGNLVDLLSGPNSDTLSPVISGNQAKLVLTTDGSNTGYGFDVDYVQVKKK